MKPVIGITGDLIMRAPGNLDRPKISLNWEYAQQLADAGGTPLIVPPQADLEQTIPLLDGWLIPGGDDIDAAQWGEENHERVLLQHPERFRLESELYRLADPLMPILGICGGCQFLNVVRGGSLQQHVPDRVGSDRHSGGTIERNRVANATLLAEILGGEVAGCASYHHQAVDRIGEGLRVSALHDDGTVEAIEATDRPWLVGVQWHPERTPGEATTRLFRAFVEACVRFAVQKEKVAAR